MKTWHIALWFVFFTFGFLLDRMISNPRGVGAWDRIANSGNIAAKAADLSLTGAHSSKIAAKTAKMNSSDSYDCQVLAHIAFEFKRQYKHQVWQFVKDHKGDGFKGFVDMLQKYKAKNYAILGYPPFADWNDTGLPPGWTLVVFGDDKLGSYVNVVYTQGVDDEGILADIDDYDTGNNESDSGSERGKRWLYDNLDDDNARAIFMVPPKTATAPSK